MMKNGYERNSRGPVSTPLMICSLSNLMLSTVLTLSRQMARQHRFQHQIKRSRKARPRPGSSAYRKAKRRRKIPALTMRALVIIRLHREVTTDPPSLLVLLPPASSPLTRPGMFCVGSGISTVLDRATPSTYEVGRNHPR